MIDSDKTKGSAIADSNSVRGMTDLHSCVLSKMRDATFVKKEKCVLRKESKRFVKKQEVEVRKENSRLNL